MEANESIAAKLSVNHETLPSEFGERGPTPANDWDYHGRARLKHLDKKNAELKRAHEILMAASAFFAEELDLRLPK